MANWKNRDRKIEKRKQFNKQGKVWRRESRPSDTKKQRIKQLQKTHWKNIDYEPTEEDDMFSQTTFLCLGNIST